MSKLILAPIRGVTTAIYRKVYSDFFSGIDEAMAPFIPTTKGEKVSRSHFKDILFENNINSIPLIPQLIGKKSSEFINAINFLQKYGYSEVNLNMGCPATQIINKGRGSGLISDPKFTETLLSEIIEKSSAKISIKIRLGVENPNDIFELIPTINSIGISSCTIHPRTAAQGYSGDIDLDRYGKALQMINKPVILSGDINNLQIFQKVKNSYPETAAWMLGRGVLQNPFLPSIIKNEHDENNKSYITIKKFHDKLYKEYSKILFGPAPLLGRMKEVWSYLYLYFDYRDGKKIFKKVKKSVNPNNYLKHVNNFFESII